MKFFSFFLLFFLIFANAAAQSTDITMMGDTAPIYQLENAFSNVVYTSESEEITVEVDNIVVEKDRILLRIFFRNLTPNWKDKVTDDNRLYGSYLPLAEIVLDDGTFLTPSSASKYSLLEYNGQLIIAGLMSFITEKQPQAFYLNLNQIPFDTAPLSEGFSKTIILKKNENYSETLKDRSLSGQDDIEFTLTAAAQTDVYTMIQPSVRMNRSDEILSKFGWITISNTETGKKYAVTRGNLYGFNLTDDSEFAPAHSYVFSAIQTPTPLKITMDHAYIVRDISPVQKSIIDLNSGQKSKLLDTEDFYLEVYKVNYRPEEDKIRIYIDSRGKQVADISFRFTNTVNDVFSPSVNCGFTPESEEFACDFFYNDISFPADSLKIEIDAVEYFMEGPWSVTWNPVPMEKINTDKSTTDFMRNPFQFNLPENKNHPDEIRTIQQSLNQRISELTAAAGWIHEAYLISYRFGDNYNQELIPLDQYEQYYTNYISETWHYINETHEVTQIITLIRDPETGKIFSAQMRSDGNTLDLLHALSADTNQPLNKTYECFTDFQQLIDSSAVFVSQTDCDDVEPNQKCLSFYQSLNGQPDSPNAQSILFRFDKETDFLDSETISYNSGALTLDKNTISLEKTDSLPEDIISLLDSIQ